MRCVARCAHSSANVAAHIASHHTHSTPEAFGWWTGRFLARAVKRCPVWRRCGGWRRGPPASHAPKPDAPCCRGLGVRSLVPCAGLGRGPQAQGAGWPGCGLSGCEQVAGQQCVGHAARPIPRGPPGAPPRRQHGCWIAHCAVACGRCLQTTCGRGRGGRTAQQRCGVAAAPVAVAVLRLRPPGRRCWPGVPPWRCRRAGRGC
ncbi:Uncharacterised protein [Comamonas terrigena]|nr:Uncharacterised protein [Comamonas terrigena]